MTLSSPPILGYDDLPPGSGVTCRRDEHSGAAEIEIPAEGFAALVRRMVRLPRFWAFIVVMLVVNNLVPLLRAYRRGWGGLYWGDGAFLAMSSGSMLLGACIGLAFLARRRATVWIDPRRLAIRSGGRWARRRAWEAERILDARSNGSAIILRLSRGKDRRPRKVALLGGRDAGELAWIARTIRQTLAIPQEADAASPFVNALPASGRAP